MRSDFDFASLYRATVGFDRVFDMLDTMAGQPSPGGYPPYNIEKTADDAWRIVMAVAGFTEAELNVTQKEDELLVTGKGHPAAVEKAMEKSSEVANDQRWLGGVVVPWARVYPPL